MDHGRAHAILSPSSAERWITCTASVGLVAGLDKQEDSGSVWAAEGTRAHSLAEIEASLALGLITKAERGKRHRAWLVEAKKHDDDVDEMQEHAQAYVDLLLDIKADMGPGTTVHLEMRLQTGVPGCWGTGDAVFVNARAIRVVDFKYGRGVPVSAVGNPQLRLYGLGALETFDGVLGDAETIGMTIHQPRINSIDHEVMLAKDLREWRDKVVLPAARETQSPDARFEPSDAACRWCPAAGVCAVRAKSVLTADFGDPNVLDESGLADAFQRIPAIMAWCKAVEAEALAQAYGRNKKLPGLKVVLSGGKRSITNVDAAIDRLVAAGYDRDAVVREDIKTLGDLEKLVGKAALPEVLGDALVKGEGRPSLVDEADERPAVNRLLEAQADFTSDLL